MNNPEQPDTQVCVTRKPVGVDANVAMLARVYNALFGGSDNYEIDRLVCSKLRHLLGDEEANFVFTSEVEFLYRAARWIAEKYGIEQWVVAAPGLMPDHIGRIHTVIRKANGDARVWYLEHEPVVLTHLRALADNGGEDGPIRVVEADPLNPESVWRQLNDHRAPPDGDPIALILGGVLSSHPGSRADVAAMTQLYRARLPPGSFIVLTHLLDPEVPELAKSVIRLHDVLGPVGSGAAATRAEIRAMVAGATILEPGANLPSDVVPAYLWWPDGPPVTWHKGRPAGRPESGQLVGAVVAAVTS